MANFHDTDYQIQLKQGLRVNIEGTAAATSGVQGEPAYTTDDKNVWIHDGTVFLPVQALNMAVVNDGAVVTDGGEIVWQI